LLIERRDCCPSQKRTYEHEAKYAFASMLGASSPATLFVGPFLAQVFHLREGVLPQFHADFFNVFNQTNSNDPNVQIGSSSYGAITGSADARNIPLGLKLTF
jgi:hypothetical protein